MSEMPPSRPTPDPRAPAGCRPRGSHRARRCGSLAAGLLATLPWLIPGAARQTRLAAADTAQPVPPQPAPTATSALLVPGHTATRPSTTIGGLPDLPPVLVLPSADFGAPRRQVAPDLLASDAATQRRVAQLIADLDSPASEVERRASDALVALDGCAVEQLNRVLLEGRPTLNLQQQIRHVLARIAMAIPDSYRRRLLQAFQEDQTRRAQRLHTALGRTLVPGHVTPVYSLDMIPKTLDSAQFDAILALPDDWPTRFIAKFLLAGGILPPMADTQTTLTPDQWQQIMQARANGQDMDPQALAQLLGIPDYAGQIAAAPMGVRLGLSTPFLIAWQATMDALHPEPANQATVTQLFVVCMEGRDDPAALDWARAEIETDRALPAAAFAPPAATAADANAGVNAAIPLQAVLNGNGDQQGLPPVYLRCARAMDLVERHGDPDGIALLRRLALNGDGPVQALAFAAMRVHWSADDVPVLVRLLSNPIKDVSRNIQLLETALAVEDPRLDAAVAARADLFQSTDLQGVLTQYVLVRGTPALIAAALKYWTVDGTLTAPAQTIALAFHQRELYLPILKSMLIDGQNNFWQYSPDTLWSMYLDDPDELKPWMYAINDVLIDGKTVYAPTAKYSQAIFEQARLAFKTPVNQNGNIMYIRAWIGAEVQLTLAEAGDHAVADRIATTLRAFHDPQQTDNHPNDRYLLYAYARHLQTHPIPEFNILLNQIDPRYGNFAGGENPALCDPDDVRQDLLRQAQGNPAFFYNRRMMAMNAIGPPSDPNTAPDPGIPQVQPLNYSFDARLTAAVNFHVPELVVPILRDHYRELRGNQPLLSSIASSLADIGQYGAGAAILERQLAQTPADWDLAQISPNSAGSQSNLANNLAWLYATALDPAWCKADRALELANRSVRLGPGESYNLDTRAYARLVAGQYAASLADFEASARLTGASDPASLAGSLARQARPLHFLHQDDEALRRLRRADQLHPMDPDSLFWMARGYGLLGRNGDALRLLARAEAAGYMNFEQVLLCHDFDALRHDRIFSEVLDNMRRHRRLVREVVVQYTPVTDLPEVADPDPFNATPDGTTDVPADGDDSTDAAP
ncbi:MAG: hypothetical protein ACREJ2_10760 [Planctomycetota bacterium]